MLSCPAQVCLGEIFTPRSGGRRSLVQRRTETVRDSLLDHKPLRHPHLTVNLAGNVSRRRNVYKFESPEVRINHKFHLKIIYGIYFHNFPLIPFIL